MRRFEQKRLFYKPICMSVIMGEMLRSWKDPTDFTSLCHFLTPEERLQLFDMLCIVIQKRIPERVSLELGIKRPNVYPYMKRRKKRLVPNAETTAKIIKALRYRGYNQAVLPVLEPAIERMWMSAKVYNKWRNELKRVNNPCTEAQIRYLEKSLSPYRMHF
jgi:hypothetical protein